MKSKFKIGELVYYTRNNKPYGKREYCIIQEIKKEFNEFGSGYLISGCWKETRNQARKCGHTRGQDYGFMRSGELYADDIKIIETNIAKEIFDTFDKYSCIKNDKWYKELKKKY